jgi:hypothetical protein
MPMNPRLLVPRASGIPSPLVISGCIGWYDSLDLTAMAQNSDGTGAVAVGDQVGYWKDKSPTAAHVTQGTGANRPTLTASQVNGRAALRFDGSNDNLSVASYSAQSSLSGLTRFMIVSSTQVAIASSSSAGGASIAIQAFGLNVYSYISSANVQWTHGGASGNLPLRIYTAVYDGSGTPSLGMYFNGVAQSSVASSGTLGATTPSGSGTMHIGSNVASNNFVAGPIAEYLIYNRTLSVVEITAVYKYLRKKWGFA